LGWSYRVVDPDTDEFASDDIDSFCAGSRIVTLHPLTIAQNSLHGCFGCSGDIAHVPPKAATIGPADIVRCKNRMEMHDQNTMVHSQAGSAWFQDLALRTVTPKDPSSILQLRQPRSISGKASQANKHLGTCWILG
jgi:hypothetical protein